MKIIKYLFLIFLISGEGYCLPEDPAGIDYHVHIQSPAMAEKMERLCGTFMRCRDGRVHSSGWQDIEASLDSTLFNRAALMSGAYLASMPELELDYVTQKQLTRSENEFIIDQAAASDRLYAFFSVNPLTDFAIAEAGYWMRRGDVSGLKLHLANADFDFFDPVHIRKLQNLLQVVDNPSMTILIHVRTRSPNFGTRDMEIFLTQIIPQAPGATWILAHAGGWGGYDEVTDLVLAQIIREIQSEKIDRDRIYLDIAAVIVPEAIKKHYPVPKDALDQQAEHFIKRFRTSDIDNWVFGSDWSPRNNALEPYHYLNELINAGMSEEEVQRIIHNKLPFVQ